MMITIILAAITMIISTVMISLATMLAKKTFTDREKSSPFECGVDPKSSARIPFSLQFFLIAVIFLIFDVEITLLLLLLVTMKTTELISFMMITVSFISILLLGLYHEWKQGALSWAY